MILSLKIPSVRVLDIEISVEDPTPLTFAGFKIECHAPTGSDDRQEVVCPKCELGHYRWNPACSPRPKREFEVYDLITGNREPLDRHSITTCVDCRGGSELLVPCRQKLLADGNLLRELDGFAFTFHGTRYNALAADNEHKDWRYYVGLVVRKERVVATWTDECNPGLW